MIKFIPAIRPENLIPSSALLFFFSNDGEIMISDEDSIPEQMPPESGTYLGTFNDLPCYCARLTDEANRPAGSTLQNIRSLYGTLSDELYSLVGYASQILTWQENHHFCSRCGAKAEPSDRERAMICPECNLMNYPRISPSMIVAVTKGDELLMARGHHFPPGLYSVVAGFLEPGETMEQCVAREVMEETGLKIKNIRYVTSQPWPFPHSIMFGFTADYVSGEILIDPKEIEDAGWYSPNNLPAEIPSKATIARKLIDDYLARHSG